MNGRNGGYDLLAGRVREQVEDILEREFARRQIEHYAPRLAQTIRRYIDRPAKLLRPVLLLETAAAYGREPSQPLLELAAATELLHTFALLHDDCIDGPFETDEPARPGCAPGAEQEAGALGMRILAGDFLHALAIGVIVDTVAHRGLPSAVLEIVRSVSLDTVLGQALDLELAEGPVAARSVEDLYRLYDLKTGRYSFDAPMQIGALCAAAPERDREPLRRLATHLGRAYQLCDDLVDTERVLRLPRERREAVAPWELNLLAAVSAETSEMPDDPYNALNTVTPLALREFLQPRLRELLGGAVLEIGRLSVEPHFAQRLLETATRHLASYTVFDDLHS